MSEQPGPGILAFLGSLVRIGYLALAFQILGDSVYSTVLIWKTSAFL